MHKVLIDEAPATKWSERLGLDKSADSMAGEEKVSPTKPGDMWVYAKRRMSTLPALIHWGHKSSITSLGTRAPRGPARTARPASLLVLEATFFGKLPELDILCV